jgi:ribosome maturation factor RimP
MSQAIPDSLRAVIDAAVQEAGMALFDLEHNGRTLQVFIDSEQGVTIDTCTRVSQLLSAKLDQSDLIPGRYFLEVSSPGLERKLRGPEDFARETGKLAHVVTAGGAIDGVIRRVEGGVVVLAVPAEDETADARRRTPTEKGGRRESALVGGCNEADERGAEREIVVTASDIKRANLRVPDTELFARKVEKEKNR